MYRGQFCMMCGSGDVEEYAGIVECHLCGHQAEIDTPANDAYCHYCSAPLEGNEGKVEKEIAGADSVWFCNDTCQQSSDDFYAGFVELGG